MAETHALLSFRNWIFIIHCKVLFPTLQIWLVRTTWPLVNVNVILFTHGAPRSSQELVQKCPCIPGSNWNLEMVVFKERGKPEQPEKNLLENSREPATNSTHIWCWVRESNSDCLLCARLLEYFVLMKIMLHVCSVSKLRDLLTKTPFQANCKLHNLLCLYT